MLHSAYERFRYPFPRPLLYGLRDAGPADGGLPLFRKRVPRYGRRAEGGGGLSEGGGYWEGEREQAQ